MNRRFDIRNQRGQAMTEFAIVLPVLALIIFAIIQLGVLFNNYVSLTDSVRAGARVAAVSRLTPDPTGLAIQKVKDASGDLDATKVVVTVASGWNHGDDVKVTATYPYSINLFGLIVKSGVITSTTTERVE